VFPVLLPDNFITLDPVILQAKSGEILVKAEKAIGSIGWE